MFIFLVVSAHTHNFAFTHVCGCACVLVCVCVRAFVCVHFVSVRMALQESKFNEGEAQVVTAYVQLLLKAGLREQEIAVITPYNGQVCVCVCLCIVCVCTL